MIISKVLSSLLAYLKCLLFKCRSLAVENKHWLDSEEQKLEYAAQKAIHDSGLILRFAQVLHLVRIRIELLGHCNELDRPDTGVYGYNLAFKVLNIDFATSWP